MNRLTRTALRTLVGLVTGLAVAFFLLWFELLDQLLMQYLQFTEFLKIVLWYLVALTVAGGVIGLFWPSMHWRLLRYVVGILVASVVLGAFFIAEFGAPQTWSHDTTTDWIGTSVGLGLPAGFMLDRLFGGLTRA